MQLLSRYAALTLLHFTKYSIFQLLLFIYLFTLNTIQQGIHSGFNIIFYFDYSNNVFIYLIINLYNKFSLFKLIKYENIIYTISVFILIT